MIKNNKIISLTVIGVLIGLVLAFVVSSANVNVVMLMLVGGIVGFLAGWVWQTRSPEAEK